MLFVFAVVQSADAQTTWTEMDMGGGWTHYSSSDGTTGYSMPMGQNMRYYSFEPPIPSDKDWDSWGDTRSERQDTPSHPYVNYGWGWSD